MDRQTTCLDIEVFCLSLKYLTRFTLKIGSKKFSLAVATKFANETVFFSLIESYIRDTFKTRLTSIINPKDGKVN